MNLLGGGSVYDIIKHRQNQQNCDHGVLEEVEIATILLEENGFGQKKMKPKTKIFFPIFE